MTIGILMFFGDYVALGNFPVMDLLEITCCTYNVRVESFPGSRLALAGLTSSVANRMCIC